MYIVLTSPTYSYVWGALADKKGRKPVVIMSCLLIGLASAAFGFSVKLYMAIIFRFLVGLFNGQVDIKIWSYVQWGTVEPIQTPLVHENGLVIFNEVS